MRRIRAAGLPGRYVAAYALATELVIDAAASEDAYTSERELVRGYKPEFNSPSPNPELPGLRTLLLARALRTNIQE